VEQSRHGLIQGTVLAFFWRYLWKPQRNLSQGTRRPGKYSYVFRTSTA